MNTWGDDMAGSRKKVVIAVVVIAAVVAAGIFGFFQLRNMATAGGTEVPDTIVLRKTDLENKVTASGNFASLDPVSVGSTRMGSEVADVFVSEGDKVYMGDVLAILKTTDIERSISDAKNAISDMSRSDRQQLEAAQRAVDEAQSQYDSDNYWTQRDINDAKDAPKQAKKAVTKAEKALADLLENPPVDPDKQEELEKALAAAIAASDAAKAAAPAAIEKAERARESAMQARASRLTEAKAQLDSLKNLDSARQSRSQLESLNEELAGASIVSPITGIVTRVLTEAGQSATGSMFMIEDAESLQISASVAEFDIIKIEEGMTAHVKSNATGSQIYEGIVDFVAPVASDLNGNFEVRILLTSGAGQLKPGMTATVEIVIAAKKDVFAVPIDAVVTKPDGTKVVYEFSGIRIGGERPVTTDGPAAGEGPVTTSGSVLGSAPVSDEGPVKGGGPVMIMNQGDGPAAGDGNRREIVVQTGMETDFYIEIISDELHEGMLIVSDPMGRNVNTMSSGPMVMTGPGGGTAIGGGPMRSEGAVTYVSSD